MRVIYVTLTLALLTLCGCNEDVESIETQEEKHPLIQEGLTYVDTKNWEQAEKSFKSAILENDRMAKPHLELANIYHQHLGPASINNFARFEDAIYHYKRYLELRPETEKKDFINEQIKDARDKWADSVFKKLGIASQVQQVKRQYETLQKENELLRSNNAKLAQQLSQLKSGSTAQVAAQTQTIPPRQTETAQTTKPVTPQPAKKAEPDHTVYNVVEGDTLSAIAKKFYGTPGKWDVIYQANRDRMSSPGDLDIGQTIIIPKLQN